jgi:hypothetical protein
MSKTTIWRVLLAWSHALELADLFSRGSPSSEDALSGSKFSVRQQQNSKRAILTYVERNTESLEQRVRSHSQLSHCIFLKMLWYLNNPRGADLLAKLDVTHPRTP